MKKIVAIGQVGQYPWAIKKPMKLKFRGSTSWVSQRLTACRYFYFGHGQAISQAKRLLMFTTSALPLLLQKAIDGLSSLLDSLDYARPDSIRAMRPERKKSLVKLLTYMLRSCSLQNGGTLIAVNGPYARPKTVKEYAAQSGLSMANVKRCLSDLRALDYLAGSQIKRKNPVNGQLEVTPGLRQFTEKFWRDLGLWDLFQEQVAWAKQHATKKLLLPFRAVKAKMQDTVKEAGQVVKQVMGKLKKAALAPPPAPQDPQIPFIPASPAPPPRAAPPAPVVGAPPAVALGRESANERVKRNCASILAMLRAKRVGKE